MWTISTVKVIKLNNTKAISIYYLQTRHFKRSYIFFLRNSCVNEFEDGFFNVSDKFQRAKDTVSFVSTNIILIILAWTWESVILIPHVQNVFDGGREEYPFPPQFQLPFKNAFLLFLLLPTNLSLFPNAIRCVVTCWSFISTINCWKHFLLCKVYLYFHCYFVLNLDNKQKDVKYPYMFIQIDYWIRWRYSIIYFYNVQY